ncbi:MAG: hypothetical protein ABEJ92_00900 [Halobacteriales archaeon]
MSAATNPAPTVPGCRPTDGTPVRLDTSAIESTAVADLRRLKRRLDDAGCVPAVLVVEAGFDADDSLATQAAADRVREYLRAADYLGVGTVRLVVDEAGAERIRQTVDALEERAERDGLALEVVEPDADL